MAVEAATRANLAAVLRGIVGRRHILSGRAARRYARGYRFGEGPVVAVARPGSLLEMWRVAQACVAADHILIVQAANTGLTGGSTPDGVYDRGVVVVSTLRIRGIYPILGGRSVVCAAGSTLYDLERRLLPLGREPHSVIGSSCIGASVVGGVCNNSGGALVDRGPAYTEYALFARLDGDGQLRLHNNLGINLGTTPEDVLAALDRGLPADIAVTDATRAGSAAMDYAQVVRDTKAATPARFNADPARLYEASGSAGRVIVMAVRLDTFARPRSSSVFYVGTNDPERLSRLRRDFLAGQMLPVSGEYMHRDAFDFADLYGKDMVWAIRLLGTDRLPALFRARAAIDRMFAWTGLAHLTDRILQTAGHLLPDQLPTRLRRWRDGWEHHLIVKVADAGIEPARALLAAALPEGAGAWFECTPREAEAAMLHRFAVAGAAVRFRAIRPHAVEEIVALDIALPRNAQAWREELPPAIAEECVAALYYGHFFCHVFHQDYIVRRGADIAALEHALHDLVAARGAQFPAEHNVGHVYAAAPALAAHYRALDPTNGLNPGIGKTSRKRNWA